MGSAKYHHHSRYLIFGYRCFICVSAGVTGVIIGRISGSLKKQSNIAAIKLGEGTIVLDA